MTQAAIIGLGLIGGSLAGALRAAGAQVCGYDQSADRAGVAVQRDLVDRVAPTIARAVDEADIVIVAVPVLAIVELLPELDYLTPPKAMLMDVGSVKFPVVEAMARLPGAARAIAGHPLAGDERSGPHAADPGLFTGKTFVLCRSAQTSDSTVQTAIDMVKSLSAEPLIFDAEEHDQVLARTSHLPQFVSTALAMTLRGGDERLAGPGLRDMTRLAGSDPAMWRDIALANREYLLYTLRDFVQQVEELIGLVESEESAEVEERLRRGAVQARTVRSRFDA